MADIAELHARLGHGAEAVKALRTAVIGQHTETAATLFQIADRLDQWNMVPQAASYAENGAKLLGTSLFEVEHEPATRKTTQARWRSMRG